MRMQSYRRRSVEIFRYYLRWSTSWLIGLLWIAGDQLLMNTVAEWFPSFLADCLYTRRSDRSEHVTGRLINARGHTQFVAYLRALMSVRVCTSLFTCVDVSLRVRCVRAVAWGCYTPHIVYTFSHVTRRHVCCHHHHRVRHLRRRSLPIRITFTYSAMYPCTFDGWMELGWGNGPWQSAKYGGKCFTMRT